MRRPAIPLAIKVLYTAWFVLWVPSYWAFHGPANFLWLCDVTNWILLPALWLESSLLLSAQAVGVLVIQSVWALDFLGRLLLGSHPVGGTEYMFESGEPLWIRSCSSFHLWVPVLLLWAVARVGYDRRALRTQSALAALILPVSRLAGDETSNLNWLWRPFGVEQTLMPPLAWLLFAMVAYPLVLYAPSHLVLSLWWRRRGQRTA